MTKLAMPLPMDQIRAFCTKWKVARLEVFGSILRPDFTDASDVDFLVTWTADAEWDVLDHVRMEREMAQLVGRRVDIVSREAVEESPNWIRKRNILSNVELIHAA